MSLEELLRSRVIRRIKPNHELALNSLKRAQRDIDTAKTLIKNEKFDWSLAVSYNAMLQAGRALMFDRGYRPSSTEGHVSVVKFLHASFGNEVSNKMIMVMNWYAKEETQSGLRRDGYSFRRRSEASSQMGRRIYEENSKSNSHGERTNLGNPFPCFSSYHPSIP